MAIDIRAETPPGIGVLCGTYLLCTGLWFGAVLVIASIAAWLLAVKYQTG